MISRLKKALAIAAMSAAAAVPAHAEDQLPPERRGGDMAVDLVLARPIGLLSVIGGSVLFVVSLPFTIPSGSTDAAAQELVKKPIDYTFKRPLGQIGMNP
jgi:hypothetical protein